MNTMDFPLSFIAAGKEMCDFDHFVPAPYLRRSIVCPEKPARAELLICGLGFYELFLNGERRTRGFLAPYITNPDQILWYDQYDLTDDFEKGENVLGLLLGNGMQNAFGGEIWDFQLARWRSAPKVSLSLRLAYADGSQETIVSDETFRTAPSPIYFDDLRAGEFYDARREIPGWNEPGFDDSGWRPAILTETPRGEARLNTAEPIVISRSLAPVWFRPGKLARPANCRSTLKVYPIPNDEAQTEGWLYDFGENAAGLCRLKIHGKPGQKVILQFSERLYHDGLDLHYMSFLPNGFDHRDIYICKGEGEETYLPSFTYHGFRYCLVLGITEEQATRDLLTYEVMHSDLHPLASFTCSDPIANAVQDAVVRSNLANFYYFPTDCPHREKNGWTGDAALSAEQMLMNHTAETSLAQWLACICAAQAPDGALPGIVPTGGWGFEWGNGPAWDLALVNLPFALWKLRGDLEPARKAAASILRYLNYLSTKTDAQGLVHFGLGDWLPVTTVRAPLELTDSIVSMDICRKAGKLFRALKLEPQAVFAETLHDKLRGAVRENLIDLSTMTAIGNCQTSQAMAIFYDVFTPAEQPEAFRRLVEIIARDGNAFDCGILGARVLFHVLSRFGRTDLAYHLAMNVAKPSYGRMIACGSDTLWEQFGMEPSCSGSLNHHFFGDISSWLVQHLAGLEQNPFERDPLECRVMPRLIDKLTHVEAFRTLPCGKLAGNYVRNGDRVTYTLTVPEGAYGWFTLENGWQFEDGTACRPLESGTYVLLRRK